LISMQGAKADACFLDAAPLSQRLLALVRAKSGDEILEGAIAPVVPMELAVVPRKKTGLHEQRELLRRGEKNVYRRAGAGFGVLHQRLDQHRTYGGPILAASREQPRARNRGARHHADELGVVGQAGLVVGAGPAPVEDELSPGMIFLIQRQRAGERAI